MIHTGQSCNQPKSSNSVTKLGPDAGVQNFHKKSQKDHTNLHLSSILGSILKENMVFFFTGLVFLIFQFSAPHGHCHFGIVAGPYFLSWEFRSRFVGMSMDSALKFFGVEPANRGPRQHSMCFLKNNMSPHAGCARCL